MTNSEALDAALSPLTSRPWGVSGTAPADASLGRAQLPLGKGRQFLGQADPNGSRMRVDIAPASGKCPTLLLRYREISCICRLLLPLQFAHIRESRCISTPSPTPDESPDPSRWFRTSETKLTASQELQRRMVVFGVKIIKGSGTTLADGLSQSTSAF
jgi:hypothetical protein